MAARVVRDAQALTLRRQGLTFDQIARKVGVANRNVAAKMVSRAVRRSHQEVVEAYRAKAGTDLLTLELALYEQIMLGQLSPRQFKRTAGSYFKASGQRRRLRPAGSASGSARMSLRPLLDVLTEPNPPDRKVGKG